jgi:Arc/MetJ-type ribon-helix-helix transcriptional regulator
MPVIRTRLPQRKPYKRLAVWYGEPDMPRGGWKTTVLKEELHERVRRLVDAGLGYRSLSELVEDAVRRRVEELERLYNLPPKPAARPPAVGGEGGHEQRRSIRPDEGRSFMKEKAGGGESG